jgi:hypothetical protein
MQRRIGYHQHRVLRVVARQQHANLAIHWSQGAIDGIGGGKGPVHYRAATVEPKPSIEKEASAIGLRCTLP